MKPQQMHIAWRHVKNALPFSSVLKGICGNPEDKIGVAPGCVNLLSHKTVILFNYCNVQHTSAQLKPKTISTAEAKNHKACWLSPSLPSEGNARPSWYTWVRSSISVQEVRNPIDIIITFRNSKFLFHVQLVNKRHHFILTELGHMCTSRDGRVSVGKTRECPARSSCQVCWSWQHTKGLCKFKLSGCSQFNVVHKIDLPLLRVNRSVWSLMRWSIIHTVTQCTQWGDHTASHWTQWGNHTVTHCTQWGDSSSCDHHCTYHTKTIPTTKPAK